MTDGTGRIVVIVLALAVLAALVDGAIVRHQQWPRERLLTASGSAQVEVEPDVATISLGVKATRDTPKLAADRVRQGVADIKAALTGLGVAEDAVETSELYLGEAQQYNYETGRTEVLGYKAYHWLRVTLRNQDFGKLADVIDAAVAAGATRLGDLQFDLDDDTTVKAQALAEATAAARQKAEAMAQASGARIVGVYRVSQSWGGPYYGRGAYEAEAAMEMPAGVPAEGPPPGPPADAGIVGEPEVPGALRVSAQVDVSFIIR